MSRRGNPVPWPSPLGKVAFAEQMTDEVRYGWLRASIATEAQIEM